ncbi:MAG: hypothetical protein K6G84_02295 [Lachnospiraceae bacterium]|nr:hypothetical protein [Lachnospiraceae bacterium]
MEEVMDNLASFVEDEIYVPLSFKLLDRLGDSRLTMIVYETLFSKCKEVTFVSWNQQDSFSNYLVFLCAAYFNGLSYKLHIRNGFSQCMQGYYGADSYDDFVEAQYEKHFDDIEWDADIELDVLDDLIDECKNKNYFSPSGREECFDAVEIISKIHREHQVTLQEDKEGFELILDKCEFEVERLESADNIAFEKQQLAHYKATIKRVEPQVERCANAVRAFERMPSLSSFVEKGIKSNIQQISKFFKWMHHSGEFEELGIDSDGIYAVRGLNHQKIRTYEMSTGQRSTIAMAVMFALHIAASDAPQFLLLDEPLATMDDTQVLNVLDILKSMAEQKTQIFFTTANGIMINLFKEAFKNTDFDYKEYEFIKRVNRPSEIKETSINDVKTIEELTLDDLTLDFNQFAQIREILRKNQEKLVPKEEWDIQDRESGTHETTDTEVSDEDAADNFYVMLTDDERKLLTILVEDDGISAQKLVTALSVYPAYKMIFEKINEKAVDFFGETVVENDDEIPWMEDDYKEELQKQCEKFFNRQR